MKYLPCAMCFSNLLPKKSIYLMACGHCIHTRCKKSKSTTFLFYNEPTRCKICKKENYGFKLLMSP